MHALKPKLFDHVYFGLLNLKAVEVSYATLLIMYNLETKFVIKIPQNKKVWKFNFLSEFVLGTGICYYF